MQARTGRTLALLALLSCAGTPASADEKATPDPVDADRWVEIDLYWFDRSHIQSSAREFWDRYAPLYENVAGWRGVILNIGWLVDPVLHWPGDLEARIPIPAALEQESWFRVTGPLTGTVAERKRQWKKRFRDPDAELRRDYQPWTYADLARLAEELRQTAARGHGLEGVRVGTFALGWESIYHSLGSRFGARHPEAFRPGAQAVPVFDPSARLEPDGRQYGAYPGGVPSGLAAGELFGAQWGSLSRAVGLDAIVLRDSVLLAGQYRRVGPYGPRPPADPARAAAWSGAVADLVRSTKQANPRALVIGYSSAASAISDWRVNLVDLETIARQGHLDAFIDQTWAGAWNEVGVRENVFWNCPYMGWTYQLGFVLMHAAILADTPTRHYVLTETFDAWESWDTIHTAPERLRWGIWAYHHAALRRPGGLEMPDGSYVSWGNQGHQLLSVEDVSFLSESLNDAVRDARATREVYGPTLVYNRAASEWLMRTEPTRAIGEWIDDVAATVMKWPVPILSSARIEDLADLDLELPILQTPVQLRDTEQSWVLDRIGSGRPIALVGSPAGGLDPAIARAAGLETADTRRGTPRRRGAVLTPVPEITDDLPEVFAVYQPFTRNVAASKTTVVHAVEGSPTLVLNLEGGRRVLAWDPPDLEVETIPQWHDEPIVTRLGSVFPWVTVARALSLWLRGGEGPWVERIEPDQPVSLGAWRLDDGSRRLLVGNLEEGLVEPAGPERSIEVSLPRAWTADGVTLRDVWGETALTLNDGRLPIVLEQAQSRLIAIE